MHCLEKVIFDFKESLSCYASICKSAEGYYYIGMDFGACDDEFYIYAYSMLHGIEFNELEEEFYKFCHDIYKIEEPKLNSKIKSIGEPIWESVDPYISKSEPAVYHRQLLSDVIDKYERSLNEPFSRQSSDDEVF